MRLTLVLLALISSVFPRKLSSQTFDPDPLNQSHIQEELHLGTLKEFGFTPSGEQAKRGLNHIFAGDGFRMFVPENLFRLLVSRESNPVFEQRRQWILYGMLHLHSLEVSVEGMRMIAIPE